MMKPATLNELKKELNHLAPQQVCELCLRLARYKKENKELLTYLLFDAHDEQQYIINIQKEADVMFAEINKSTLYYVKKGFRKILRLLNKHIKYSGNKQTEAELLLYYCSKLKKSGIRIEKDKVINNLYQRQVERIKKAVSTLHEDLQYDYGRELERIS